MLVNLYSPQPWCRACVDHFQELLYLAGIIIHFCNSIEFSSEHSNANIFPFQSCKVMLASPGSSQPPQPHGGSKCDISIIRLSSSPVVIIIWLMGRKADRLGVELCGILGTPFPSGVLYSILLSRKSCIFV